MEETEALVLHLIAEYEFRDIFVNSITKKDDYIKIINDIIDDYTVGGVTKTDVINVLDKFQLAIPGATFDTALLISNIWDILINLQKFKNKSIVKGTILTEFEKIIKDDLDAGDINQSVYEQRLNNLIIIIDEELMRINNITLEPNEIQRAYSKINNRFVFNSIEYDEIYKGINKTIKLSIFKSNIVTTFTRLFNPSFTTEIKTMVDTIFNINQTGVAIDNIIVQVMDALNVQLTIDGIKALKKELLAELERYRHYEGIVTEGAFVNITPRTFIDSSLVLQETEVISVEVSPLDPVALISTEKLEINSRVENVDTMTNVDEYGIRAKIIEPVFKVNVCGTDCGIPIDEDDTFKVLTNDGTEAYWENVNNLLGEQAGFLKIVDSLGDRNNIPMHHRMMGMLVYVKSRDTYYKCESSTDNSWTIFKQGLYPHRIARTVIFENVKLGHGDKGSDMRVGDIKSDVIQTKDEYSYIDEHVDVEFANLISFKNVGYHQATIKFDGNTHLLNPNSVFELPFDGTLRFKVKGIFNFVSAFVTFDTTVETIKSECCDPIVRNYEQGSIFDPYF